MRVNLQTATRDDVADLVSLRLAVSRELSARFGHGHWSAESTARGVLFAMRSSGVYVARYRDKLICSVTLSPKKPWAIDKKYFHASKRPPYLTVMAVNPEVRRKGVGRLCMDEVRRIASSWPGDALRLDAYDAAAGAGDSYRKCGFEEVGRAMYRTVPLIYFEMLL